MSNQETKSSTRRATYQKVFEFTPSVELENNLIYFMTQELNYYNSLISQLTPRLRAFPKEILHLRDKDLRLWEVCAEYAVDPNQLVTYPVEQWPKHLQHHGQVVYDQQGNSKISAGQISVLAIAAGPARLHAHMRKHMAVEILNYMYSQADTLLAAQKTDTMRAPMQMLQTCTVDNKRHIQLERRLVKINYDAESGDSLITVPYSKEPIRIANVDISESRFTIMVIRCPHPGSKDKKWHVELKDPTSKYLINLTDYTERRRK